MGIVRFALRFPHTFYVLAALILFLGGISVWSMPTDIFPEIRIPVVTVIWSYTGLSTPEMEQRVSTYSQYSISANVSGIKNIEAQTLNGLSVQKIYFQPDVNLDLAISQIVSATNAIRALMPPGIQPPVIVQFNASSVPVLQLSLESDKLNEQQLYDFGIYRIRQQLAPVPGVTLPTPAGGKYRQIMVDIDPNKLSSRGLTPLDIVNAVNTQNLTLPTGTAKIGDTQYTVRTNATPASIKDLNMIPVKFANGATILLDGDQGDGDAAERRRIGAIAVQHGGDIDAEPDPDAEHGEQEAVGLREYAGDRNRCHDPYRGREQPVAGLFHALTACRQRQDRYGQGCRRGGFELEPEARIEREHHRQPYPQRKDPGACREAGEDQRGRHGSTGGVHGHRASSAFRQSVPLGRSRESRQRL